MAGVRKEQAVAAVKDSKVVIVLGCEKLGSV